jgi:hypothetical protein
MGYYPDMVDSVAGELFFILQPAHYLPEAAAYFVLLYCLSMTARYYPDIWMSFISDNVRGAELVDTLLNFAQRKFPHLMLDQLTDAKHLYQTSK